MAGRGCKSLEQDKIYPFKSLALGEYCYPFYWYVHGSHGTELLESPALCVP
ncbi:hypothetical protein BN873_190055 [Candidatus Competibacter denitrificans Run_A_D11]|uniref:Uncharacterized protein n=1 Tax=Candidatus Competibacter denitrificans Run_A_D11 TaxID=1400863 RepID=W6M2E0_9GAMM|nr:hypothetical protein BN873_190055 [Candidatus Competibacter denitrificans Run_A_D11]